MESQSISVTCGVPQVSTLGSQLFLIFINDIVKIFKWSEFRLYADNTVFYTFTDIEENDALACQHLQQDLLSLSDWSRSNAIRINVKKTKAMTFGTWYTLGQAEEMNLAPGDTIIKNVGSYKYLGTFLDEHLSFEQQANETICLVLRKSSNLFHQIIVFSYTKHTSNRILITTIFFLEPLHPD